MNSCAVLPSLVAVVCCLSTLFPSKENARNESRAEKISHPAIYFIRLNDTFWPSRAVKKTAHAPGRTETNVGYRGGPLYHCPKNKRRGKSTANFVVFISYKSGFPHIMVSARKNGGGGAKPTTR